MSSKYQSRVVTSCGDKKNQLINFIYFLVPAVYCKNGDLHVFAHTKSADVSERNFLKNSNKNFSTIQIIFLQYGYSELSDISHYSVKVMCVELLFADKWLPMAFVGGHFSAKSSSAHITFTL